MPKHLHLGYHMQTSENQIQRENILRNQRKKHIAVERSKDKSCTLLLFGNDVRREWN